MSTQLTRLAVQRDHPLVGSSPTVRTGDCVPFPHARHMMFVDTGRALLFQVPINVLSAIFIWWKMSFPAPIDASDGGHVETTSGRPKWQRIDFPGAISIGIANTLLLLLLDEVQREPDVLHDPRALVTGGGWIAFIAIFIATESTWAREPIFPLRLMIRRSIFSSYSIQFLQTAAQMAVRHPLRPAGPALITLSCILRFHFIFASLGQTLTLLSLSDVCTFSCSRWRTTDYCRVTVLVITLGTILGGLISGIYIQRCENPCSCAGGADLWENWVIPASDMALPPLV